MAGLIGVCASQSSLLLLQQKPSLVFGADSLLAPSSHQFSNSGLVPLRISLIRQGSNRGSIVAFSSGSGSGGGGGGAGHGRGAGGGGGGYGDSEGEGENKKMGISMSQKLTLGYAALVGVGGVMGYLKSKSQKSLAAGGLSAALLYYVYTLLPSKPAFASSIGLGLSAALLFVMGSRFKNSRKVFPAGVVSVVSLVMTGGYLHGILRSLH